MPRLPRLPIFEMCVLLGLVLCGFVATAAISYLKPIARAVSEMQREYREAQDWAERSYNYRPEIGDDAKHLPSDSLSAHAATPVNRN